MLSNYNRVLHGTLIALGGSFIYVIFGILSKLIQTQLSFSHLLFLQSIAGLSCAVTIIRMQKFDWSLLWTDFHYIYLVRIIISLASMFSFIYGLKYVSVYNALVILNICPFIMPILRFIFFRNKIHNKIFVPILFAFCGIILILSPDQQILHLSTLTIVASMLCMAFSLLLLEHKNNTSPVLAIFYYFLVSSIITGFAILFFHQTESLSFNTITLGLITGVMFFLVQLSLIYATRYISSQFVSVLFYSEIIFALIASLLMGSMQWSVTLLIGTIFVLIGGYTIFYIEKSTQTRLY